MDETCSIYCYTLNIATCYGLDGPGIEPRRGGEIIRARPVQPWGPTSLLYHGYWVSYPRVKRPGYDGDRSPHLAPRLKKG